MFIFKDNLKYFFNVGENVISPPTVGRMLDISYVSVNLELYFCSYFGWSRKKYV